MDPSSQVSVTVWRLSGDLHEVHRKFVNNSTLSRHAVLRGHRAGTVTLPCLARSHISHDATNCAHTVRKVGIPSHVGRSTMLWGSLSEKCPFGCFYPFQSSAEGRSSSELRTFRTAWGGQMSFFLDRLPRNALSCAKSRTAHNTIPEQHRCPGMSNIT